MKTIDLIRRENLALLIQQFGMKDLSEKLGKSRVQITNWKNAAKDSGTGKPRGISDGIARYIEEKTEKDVGWLDNDHQRTPELEGNALHLMELFAKLTITNQGRLIGNAEQMLKDSQGLSTKSRHHSAAG